MIPDPAVDSTDYSLTASPGRRLPIAVRAEGCRIWDRDGREYLDACGGAMVMTLGHRHPRLVDAAKRQLDELTFTYRFSFGNEPMLDLAGLMREIAPMDRAWAFFNSSGSESVESAIHLALLYWQHLGQPDKVELISRYPSFHGSTIGALGLSGSRWRQAFEQVLEKSPVAQAPNSDIRSRRTPEEELAFGLAQIEQALVERGARERRSRLPGAHLRSQRSGDRAAGWLPRGRPRPVRSLPGAHDLRRDDHRVRSHR